MLYSIFYLFIVGLINFLQFIHIFIFIDIILSWLTIFGLNWRIKFIKDILTPIYSFIKKYLPTNLGPLDFTPIILLFIIVFITGLLNNLI